MKKVTLLIVALLLSLGTVKAADVNEPDRYLTAWLSGANLAYQNTDLSVWLGFRGNLNKDIDIEGGPAFNWRMWSEGDSEEHSQSDFAVGAYVAVHFLNLVNIPNPIPIEQLPDQLAGEPFVAFEYLIDTDGKGTSFSPSGGIRVFEVLAVMYQYQIVQGERVPDQSRIAISTKFKF